MAATQDHLSHPFHPSTGPKDLVLTVEEDVELRVEFSTEASRLRGGR